MCLSERGVLGFLNVVPEYVRGRGWGWAEGS